MSTRNYWLDLFTGTTWKEFLDAGANVSGFRDSRWSTVRQIKIGDYLLCYLTGVSRWIGVLEVVSAPYQDASPIWKQDTFPCRVKVRMIAHLTPETGVPVVDLRDRLTIFQNLSSPFAWTGYLRGSPVKWKTSDGEAVVGAIQEAQQNPVVRPVDMNKLARLPKTLRAKELGSVTVPDVEISLDKGDVSEPSTPSISALSPAIQEESSIEPTLHTETQWLLLKLGNDMGLHVWAARNDRNREVRGQKFTDLPRLLQDLPLQFDEATNRTIELIDVLWLKGNAIVAAFEIECTTSIYSGLLRMSDLIAMQPNLNIPLYLVAPDERRSKVFVEVNRPTFSRLSPPMNLMCRFISTSALHERVQQIGSFVRHLRPEFLEDLSETCELDDA